ncbi:hypothetical protein T4E_9586 [Trichinella pseudospiralis]|uniref:Uncharacterized protein n=1 Tax=Trichinella pseudospiralis TaxID=6337 RepID=A0A0V0Y8E6_TRIPS|nr:hypothetical protein T4E_9586 [Trichinella pseudospiralis]
MNLREIILDNGNYAFCAAAICRGCYVHIHVINLSTCCPGRLVCGHDIASKRTSLNVSDEKNDLGAVVAGTFVLEHFPTQIKWVSLGQCPEGWRRQHKAAAAAAAAAAACGGSGCGSGAGVGGDFVDCFGASALNFEKAPQLSKYPLVLAG